MLRKIFIGCIGFALPFVVGEAFLQWADPYHFGEKEDWSQFGAKILDRQTGRLRKGAVGTYLGKRTVISSQGWRSPEFAVPKPDGVFRIVWLGGSVSFGWGVEQGDEFPRVLERRLNEAKLAGDRRIEVINTGVPGWKLRERLVFLQDEALGWQPDLVVLMLVATDVPKPERSEKSTRSFFLNDSIRRVRLARAVENRYVFDAPGSAGEDYDAYAHLSDEGLDQVCLGLGLFADACRKAGVRLVVVDTLNQEKTRARCAERKLHRIDGFTSWQLRRSWEVAVTDAHPNAEGHRFLVDRFLAGMVPALFEDR